MFSTRDLISRKDSLGDAWRIGMTEDINSRDRIMQADIQAIASEIITNQSSIPLRLSTMVMKGTVIIYKKKTGFVYGDCKDVLTRISLKYENVHDNDKNTEPKNAKGMNSGDKQVIDDETIGLWEQSTLDKKLLENTDENHGDGSNPPEIEVPRTQNSLLLDIEESSRNLNPDGQNYGLDQEENLDLGINLSDDENDSIIPANSDEEIQEPKKTKSKEYVLFDVTPRISISEFWDGFEENQHVRRPRVTIAPNFNGLAVIAEPLASMFLYIKENAKAMNPLNFDDEAQNFESDFGAIPFNDDDPNPGFDENSDVPNPDTNELSQEASDKIISMIKSGNRNEMYFGELSQRMSKIDKATAFYTSLALCSQGVVELVQNEPSDDIKIIIKE